MKTLILSILSGIMGFSLGLGGIFWYEFKFWVILIIFYIIINLLYNWIEKDERS